MVNFRAEEPRITPEPTKAIRTQFHGPGKPGGRKGILPYLYALRIAACPAESCHL